VYPKMMTRLPEIIAIPMSPKLEILVKIENCVAPIFGFTAEEMYSHIPKDKNSQAKESVHLLAWPQRNALYAQDNLGRQAVTIEAELKPVMDLIPDAAKILEDKRSRGEIGSSFEAKIILLTNDDFRYKYLESLREILPELFKVSQVEINRAEAVAEGKTGSTYQDVAITVEKAGGKKCVRCWNFSNQVGQSRTHPLICERCLKAIKQER